MRISRFALLGTPLLSATLVAQVPPIPPAVTVFSATSTATGAGLFEPLTFPPLNAGALGAGGQVGQLEARRLLPNTNFYRIAATVSGLSAALGGKGNFDVVEGVYDAGLQILTAGNRAAAFNTAQAEFALSIEERGLVGACDGPTGPVFSVRGAVNQVFPAVQFITGVPTGYIDSKLFREGNRLKYAWVAAGGDIWVGDFQANGSVTNQVQRIPVSVVQAATSSYTGMHSHHPITEEIPAGSGNYKVHGWLISGQQAAGDSDSFFLPTGDPTLPFSLPPRAHRLWDEPTWQNNPTTLGITGSSYWAFGEPAPRGIPMVAMTGDNFETSVASQVSLRLMSPHTITDQWRLSAWFGVPIGPVAIPFAIGNPLGQPSTSVPPGLLGNTGIVQITVPVAPGVNSGGFTLTFNVAANSVPPNVPINMQIIGINFTTGKIYTGNTAVLEGR